MTRAARPRANCGIDLPSRFGAFVASCITLIVLYVRFALQTAELW